jgi:HAD superfamily hydrolase (TIGR01509 family)
MFTRITGLSSRIELRLSVVTPTLPAAVLWDMDGTLIDTEPYWMAAEHEIVEGWGGEWTHEDALSLIGSGLWNSARMIQSRGVFLTEQEIVDELTDRVLAQLVADGPLWRPGAHELLTEIREAGIPTALVTMSVSRMANHVAHQLGFDAFDHVVSGDTVSNAKPHPEPYLRAAELLGVEPGACVAIEDSAPGIASAVAAGMVVVGVPFIGEVERTAHWTHWPSLEGRRLSDLTDLFAAVATS